MKKSAELQKRITGLEGKWEVDGMWIDPKLLMKIGVFKVVNEKECSPMVANLSC